LPSPYGSGGAGFGPGPGEHGGIAAETLGGTGQNKMEGGFTPPLTHKESGV